MAVWVIRGKIMVIIAVRCLIQNNVYNLFEVKVGRTYIDVYMLQ